MPIYVPIYTTAINIIKQSKQAHFHSNFYDNKFKIYIYNKFKNRDKQIEHKNKILTFQYLYVYEKRNIVFDYDPFFACFILINKVDIVLQYLSCRFLHNPEPQTMKGTSIRSQSHYLDISQYLLKEHSPCFRPKVPEQHQVPSPRNLTPELSPVIDGLTGFVKTPLAKSGKEIGYQVLNGPDMEDFNDFSLQDANLFRNQTKSKKIRKVNSRPRLHSTWHHVDHELDQIIEQNDRQQEVYQKSSYCQSGSDEEEEDSLQDYDDSSIIQECKQIELEKQSTTHFDLLLSQEPLFLEWHNPNPKKELLAKIKTVCSNQQIKTDQEKIENLKSTIGNYIFDHEKFYFEESMNQLSGNISNILSTLIKGIDQTFRKTIGGLSFEKRRLKLVKYMEKKRRRVWRKKVNYDCRKKVADGRLRIKGKFVTYEQAREQLGMSSLEGYNADEIRNMIERKSTFAPDC